MAAREGRQTPTQSHILPYRRSLGTKAAALYKASGRRAQDWQKSLLKDMMACTQGKGLWIHTKFGFSVPRRSGKNEVLLIREMYGLVELGEHILHTAHRTTTTHAAWERLYDRLGKLEGVEIVSSYRAYGKEHIELSTGGKIEFRTRTSKGGLGEGFDLLVIDEAQEYQDDQESARRRSFSAPRRRQSPAERFSQNSAPTSCPVRKSHPARGAWIEIRARHRRWAGAWRRTQQGCVD